MVQDLSGADGIDEDEYPRRFRHIDGKFLRVTEGWKFPDASPDIAFELFVHGNQQ